jgi:type IV secretion system protein TrbC
MFQRLHPIAVVIAMAALLAPEIAMATSSSGGGLPWEAPLTTLTNSIKGPVAYAISLMGIIAAGAMLVWGGEVNEFLRRLVMLILVISLIVFASNVLSTLFNAGAVI